MPMDASESPKGSEENNAYPVGLLSVTGKVKVPLAMLGTWKHPSYGTVSFTQEDLEQIKHNYSTNSLGFTPYLTFGHLAEEPKSTDAHRKRGDMGGVIQEGPVLFGLFDTPDYIADMVRRGEYEYSSGEFIRNLHDKQTGAQLGCAVSRVALTNSPFIPFGDIKVQALSQSVEGDYQTFLIELARDKPLDKPQDKPLEQNPVNPSKEPEPLAQPQVDIPVVEPMQGTTPPPSEPKKEEPMTQTPNTPEETKVEVKSDPAPTPVTQQVPLTPAAPQPQITNTAPVPSVAVPNPSTPMAPPATGPQTINVEDLVQQIRAGLQAEFQAERLQSQTVINTLQAQVNELKGDLLKQKETSHVFSQTVARAQEEAQQKQLLSQGMPPVIVPKYIMLHQALLSGQSTIKLSQGAEGEKDVTTLALLQEVITECLSMGGVPISQMGSTAAPTPGGLVGDLKAIIEKNKQLANGK